MENELEYIPPCIKNLKYDLSLIANYFIEHNNKDVLIELNKIEANAKIAPNYIEYLKNKKFEIYENTSGVQKSLWQNCINQNIKGDKMTEYIISCSNTEINVTLNEINNLAVKKKFFDKMWDETLQYLHNITLYHFIEEEINKYKSDNYYGIINDLEGYVEGASEEDIVFIIKNKCLPNGKNKIKWIGSKADAFRFAYIFYLRDCQLKKCFTPKDGGNFTASMKPKIQEGNSIPEKIYSNMEKNSSLYGKLIKYKSNPI